MHAQTLCPEVFQPFSPCAHPFLAFETENYRVVFKPAGMHSLPAPQRGIEKSSAEAEAKNPIDGENSPGEGREDLLSWVKAKFLDQSDAFAAKTGKEDILHRRAERELGMLSRLDRDTSGLMAFARSPDIFFHAQKAQASGRTSKRYWLLAREALHEEGLIGSTPRLQSWVEGDPVLAGREFSLECHFRSYGQRGYRVACLAPEIFRAGLGRKKKNASPALYRSDFHPLSCLPAGSMGSWSGIPGLIAMEASISAGFRHQIRAHMAWCGHPIAGDSLYGIRDYHEDATGRGARLFLECHRIELESPDGGIEIFELAKCP